MADMPAQLPVQRVEVSFVGAPPVARIERASGVSKVERDGSIVRCLVAGSFQPFLEALRGHEVVTLRSTWSPCDRRRQPPHHHNSTETSDETCNDQPVPRAQPSTAR
ncbi:hypothetical protein F4560_003227 [Saccharothrix ecbatanensis]|uniref:Uncharacterized protein n=1 Tax=Saccharothrix ecbatanensis TaxID=1105145 RepID=A0A7W9M101_9PSEU|nr:hypothetical protein [Saccharothrix ecbatanensis]MBB5803459.1 hypothetical protein [Saccharothrix ecbatanensis]